MNYQNAEIPLKDIIKVFKQINVNDILSIAKDIQKRLITDTSLILKGDKNEYKLVTQADIKIQKLLLDYFDSSSLKSTYRVITEEAVSNKSNNKNFSWTLLIDPLDGTNSFVKQNKTWGVMVGACDCNGILRYSWNLISTGDIFSSGSKQILKESLQSKITKKKSIMIDVYDYDSQLSRRVKESLKIVFNMKDNQIIQASCPASIWAGYQLYRQSLDYLLWIPSDKGKKNYPSYDLIFLGALIDKGYNIIIGRKENINSIVAIGSILEDTEKIYEIGFNLLSKNQRKNIKKIVNKLKIVN